MKLSILSSLALLLVSVSARVGGGGGRLELSQIRHRKLRRAAENQGIEGQFIIVLSDAVVDIVQYASQLLQDSGAEVKFEYNTVMKGFTVSQVVAELLKAILDDSMVDYVEEDQILTEDAAVLTQNNPPSWGLDRVDGNLDHTYEYSLTGKGVEIYVFDTGVNPSHEEFSGRVSCGYSAIPDEDCTDFRGHGSHTTGTAIGSTYGVAKEATVVAIKVLDQDGNGSLSGILAGIEFVTNKKLSNKDQPMVANMSLGGPASDLLNNAVSDAIAAGVVFVASAGNDGGNACDQSPASCADVITVSAVDISNNRPSYANYGSCVDIFGPGSNIVSAWWSSSTATNLLSGTSMAAPHVAGVAALFLERNPSMTPAEVKAAILSDGIAGVVNDRGDDSPNILLSTRDFFGSPTSAADVPPSPSAASPATAPAPSPSPVSSPVRKPNQSDNSCNALWKGCTKHSDCCSGSCWLGNISLGFCAIPLD